MSVDPSRPAVVAFGAGETGTDRNAFTRYARHLWQARGIWRVGAVAVLAAAAGFASLAGLWFTVTLPRGNTNDEGVPIDIVFRFGASEGGALGSAYVFGLFGLALAIVFVLFGHPRVRAAVRLGGLTLAGCMAVMLLALRLTFDNYPGDRIVFAVTQDPQSDTGAGFTYAFLTVGLGALALFLAGSPRTAQLDEAPARGESHRVDTDWSWRPPRPVRDETAAEVAAAAPPDLTVQPVRPFAHPDAGDGHGGQ